MWRKQLSHQIEIFPTLSFSLKNWFKGQTRVFSRCCHLLCTKAWKSVLFSRNDGGGKKGKFVATWILNHLESFFFSFDDTSSHKFSTETTSRHSLRQTRTVKFALACLLTLEALSLHSAFEMLFQQSRDGSAHTLALFPFTGWCKAQLGLMKIGKGRGEKAHHYLRLAYMRTVFFFSRSILPSPTSPLLSFEPLALRILWWGFY